MGRNKILIVDDSFFVRSVLSRIISELGFSVDTASDGEEGVKKALSEDYDLITLDIEMPKKNGIQALKEIMSRKPSKVLIISSYTTSNAELTLEALSLGAIGYITKPGRLGVDIKKIKDEIKEKITEVVNLPEEKIPTKSSIVVNKPKKYLSKSIKYIFIGASTGGPRHIEQILSALPPDYPHPISIVQHMPPKFTEKFAQRMDKISKIKVSEAKTSEPLEKGKAVIGKGGYHLSFLRNGGNVYCNLIPDEDNSLFVPSVDKMFLSALETFEPEKITAVLLTGIGDDGARGMLELRKAGATTIAESEETAVVYGMPKAAYDIGAVEQLLPLNQIIQFLLNLGAD